MKNPPTPTPSGRRKPKAVQAGIHLVEHTTFRFAHEENANRVGMALASSGYFIKVRRENTAYELTVFKYAS